MRKLAGQWHVRRESGLLPPFGIQKRIGPSAGVTCIGIVPVLPFRIRGNELRYWLLPIVDVLTPQPDGTWAGRGLIFGREFCRFRLEPRR
jgi:hypothetical protein